MSPIRHKGLQLFEILQTLLRFGRKRLGISESGRTTPVVTTPKMVPSSTVMHVEPAKDPDPTSETQLESGNEDR